MTFLEILLVGAEAQEVEVEIVGLVSYKGEDDAVVLERVVLIKVSISSSVQPSKRSQPHQYN